MGKGDKQHGNREGRKPKADKKLPLPPTSFIKPQATSNPAGKPAK